MTSNICNRMLFNCDTINQITIWVGVFHICNGMTVAVDISIKTAILIAFLNTLTNKFDEINSRLIK